MLDDNLHQEENEDNIENLYRYRQCRHKGSVCLTPEVPTAKVKSKKEI